MSGAFGMPVGVCLSHPYELKQIVSYITLWMASLRRQASIGERAAMCLKVLEPPVRFLRKDRGGVAEGAERISDSIDLK